MAKYLVTGGAGFIGSHIVEELLNTGNSVVVLDNFSSGKLNNLLSFPISTSKFTLITGDIRNKEDCLEACNGVDYILHQAALRCVPRSLKIPHKYNDVNITGTLNILETAKECKVKRVVLASSSSIYGDTDIFPQKETDCPLLVSPYALSKLAGEYYCRIFSKNFDVETVALRYFNVFGPRQSIDDDYAVVIPKFITCLLKKESPTIFGDGTQSRDFTFVKDIVKANILAATTPNISGQVFNVACGQTISINELYSKLKDIIKVNVLPKYLSQRIGDIKTTFADISKIKWLMGYNPSHTFDEALTITVDWFVKNKDLL